MEKKLSLPKANKTLDIFGISLSVGCAIHCIGLSLLFLFLPSWFATEHGETHFHAAMLLPIFPVTFISMRKSLQSGTSKWPISLSLIGISLLVLDVFSPIHLDRSFPLHLIPILGSLLLVISHSINLLTKKCSHQ
jgi:membrane-anchored protein YejM (alkaline phosphatase superfamily)